MFIAAAGTLGDGLGGEINLLCSTQYCYLLVDQRHTQCIVEFPLQQWLSERVTVLRYTYSACLVITEREWVCCAVRTGSINVIRVNFVLEGADRCQYDSRSHVVQLYRSVGTAPL